MKKALPFKVNASNSVLAPTWHCCKGGANSGLAQDCREPGKAPGKDFSRPPAVTIPTCQGWPLKEEEKQWKSNGFNGGGRRESEKKSSNLGGIEGRRTGGEKRRTKRGQNNKGLEPEEEKEGESVPSVHVTGAAGCSVPPFWPSLLAAPTPPFLGPHFFASLSFQSTPHSSQAATFFSLSLLSPFMPPHFICCFFFSLLLSPSSCSHSYQADT